MTTETMAESATEKAGWMADMDRMHPPGQHSIGPWSWVICDHSMAILCVEGDEIAGHVMAISPCKSCADHAQPKEWLWGRCQTPRFENARLIEAAPELLAALKELVGTDLVGDSNPNRRDDATYRPVISWGTRQRARAAIAKAEGAVTASL